MSGDAMNRSYHALDVVIPSGAAVPASPINLPQYREASIQTPDTLTQDGMGFDVSNDGETFATVKDDAGGDITDIVVAVDKCYVVPPEVLQFAYWRPRMDGNEGADRTLKVLLKG